MFLVQRNSAVQSRKRSVVIALPDFSFRLHTVPVDLYLRGKIGACQHHHCDGRSHGLANPASPCRSSPSHHGSHFEATLHYLPCRLLRQCKRVGLPVQWPAAMDRYSRATRVRGIRSDAPAPIIAEIRRNGSCYRFILPSQGRFPTFARERTRRADDRHRGPGTEHDTVPDGAVADLRLRQPDDVRVRQRIVRKAGLRRVPAHRSRARSDAWV